MSEDYHSATSVTTPDSSRAHSENNFMTSTSNIGAGINRKKVPGQHAEGPPSSSSRLTTDDELDPIQVAALKVRAAFPDHPSRPLNLERRGHSDSGMLWDSPRSRPTPLKFADRVKTRPPPLSPEPLRDDGHSPPLRDLILSKDQSSVAAPWPATYLEAARKAAPTAAPPRAARAPSQPSPTLSALSGPPPPPSIRSQISLSGGSDIPPRSPPQAASSSPQSLDSSHGEPLAKMFVECCGCRYYHDMPSKLYEAMSHPQGILGDPEGQGVMDYAGSLSTTVRCPWCQHEMSTKCCAGLVAMVYVKQRLH